MPGGAAHTQVKPVYDTQYAIYNPVTPSHALATVED